MKPLLDDAPHTGRIHLQTDTFTYGADVVAEVKLSCGAFPGKNAVSAGVVVDRGS